MSNFKFFLLFALSIVLLSCAEDSNSPTDPSDDDDKNQEVQTWEYYPMALGNTWEYSVYEAYTSGAKSTKRIGYSNEEVSREIEYEGKKGFAIKEQRNITEYKENENIFAFENGVLYFHNFNDREKEWKEQVRLDDQSWTYYDKEYFEYFMDDSLLYADYGEITYLGEGEYEFENNTYKTKTYSLDISSKIYGDSEKESLMFHYQIKNEITYAKGIGIVEIYVSEREITMDYLFNYYYVLDDFNLVE